MSELFVLTDVSVADYRPMVAKMWHPTRNGRVTPDKVMIGADLTVWWLCPRCGVEFADVVRRRVTNDGIGHTGCANPLPEAVTVVREVRPDDGAVRGRRPRYLIDVFPEITARFNTALNTLKVTEVKISHRGTIWWDCPNCNQPWKATVTAQRTGLAHRCSKDKTATKAKGKSGPPKRHVAGEFPAIAAELDKARNELTADQILISHRGILWWSCPNCQNAWSATLRTRRAGIDHGCAA